MAWTTTTNVSTGDPLPASTFNNQVLGNLNEIYAGRRFGYVTRTTDYAVSAVSTSAAADVFASDITFTADGTSTYWVEFGCALVECGATASSIVAIHLVDGSGNDIYRVALTGQAGNRAPVFTRTPYTPASGSRSVNIRAFYSASAGTLKGDTAGYAPIWMAVYGPDLT